jgi:hypothetical protein
MAHKKGLLRDTKVSGPRLFAMLERVFHVVVHSTETTCRAHRLPSESANIDVRWHLGNTQMSCNPDIPVTRLEVQLHLHKVVHHTIRECYQVMYFGLAYALYVPALYTP